MGLTGAPGATGAPGPAGPAGSGALRVVDSGGSEVGLLAPPNSVIRQIDGTWVQLALNSTASSATDGFASCTAADGCLVYYFTQANCQGTAYLVTSNSLVQDGVVIDGNLLYPQGAVASRTFQSVSPDGTSCSQYEGTMDAAAMGSVAVSSLGVAPFHLSR